MKKFLGVILALGLTCLLVTVGACVSAETSGPAATAPKVITPVTKTEAWEKEWERTLAAAKQEGGVSITTALGAGVQRGISEGFKEKYGIGIGWDAGRGAENIAKIIAQRRAGLYTFDVVLTGLTSLRTLPDDTLEPMEKHFILPEIITATWKCDQYLNSPGDIHKDWE